MKVLITGATGFIGARLRHDLAAAGHEVLGVTRNDPPPATPRCTWLRMDLSDPSARVESLDDVDAVIYLAQAREYREFPDKARAIFSVNDAGVLTLLDWARQRRARVFIYASSANVYPSSLRPIPESTQPEPSSFYGRSKQIGEMLVTSYADYFRCVVLRLFTVYGPGQTGMLIPSLVEKIRAGQPVQLQGTDGLRLSPLFVSDTARMIGAALEGADRGAETLNLGGDEALSLREISLAIGEAVGRRVEFESSRGPEAGGWVSDNRRSRERLAVVPAVRFRDGIRQVVAAATGATR